MTKTLGMAKLRRKYRVRILRLLNGIRQAFIKAGYAMDEPFEISDREYAWSMFGGPAGRSDQSDETCFSVDLTILESQCHDKEDPFGVNFGMSIVGHGGEIIGNCVPFNYSDRVWVSRKEPEAVQERWELFESWCDPNGVLSDVQEHYEGKSE